ncbi:AAA family ATPase [Desulfoscipio gibsoniae]|uniref:Endonuclease GajA/Old nuclease/RecF-like AAA domain-containing protein n=1 Tax=Desulfoscipio gibsoniae DSM 7213 TaxID=767817 RepID=R4KFX3_9FIRM|nr:AAA family ATPase [Desulfoscipio gibsoniae]AGL00547.1 hypothetical protein Desgi_1009 [Desulfoscipio gibsoniae DSM 7213]
MLKGLTIEGFKAFSKKQIFKLAPITLIFGANSAGKSSLLQSLLLLKQTLEESESGDAVLVPKGKIVNLGSYKEMIYGHETEKNITFSMNFSLSQRDYIDYRGFNKNKMDEVGCEIKFCLTEKNKIDLSSLTYSINKIPLITYGKTSINETRNIKQRIFRVRGKYGNLYLKPIKIYEDNPVINDIYDQFMNRKSNLIKILKEKSGVENYTIKNQDNVLFDDLIEYKESMHGHDLTNYIMRLSSYDYNYFCEDFFNINYTDYLSCDCFLPVGTHLGNSKINDYSISLGLLREYYPTLSRIPMHFSSLARNFFNKTIYLGPLREYPERHYIYSGNMPSNVGKSGKNMADLLFTNKDLTQKANEWFDKFNIHYNLLVKRIDDPDVEDVFSLRLIDRNTGISVSPLDVGFGISQILPIIVQGLLSNSSVIIIEQPEIHIHPKLQATFGSFLEDCVKNNNNKFIIETHSEHLML